MADERLSRTELVEAAIETWTRRLVSLDGRNRMLYFRELAQGTLEISPHLDVVVDSVLEQLLAGESVLLSELVVADALASAARKVRVIASKAQSNIEEKGLATLYIGHSFASWSRSDGRTPNAPVVMIPVHADLLGTAGEDVELKATGPPEVNLPFVFAIRRDLGFDPYPDADERSENIADWLEHVRRKCSTVSGFSLDERVFLTNLEFSKLPMVVDIEQHLDMLVANDIVAAMAGDEKARIELKRSPSIDPDYPDHVEPLDEFLVCDADASQNYSIVAVQRGHSMVVHGPPGTGKSQTIANLISTLAANGKSVLFVAEKRAAIGAVTRRLDEAGCGDLVLDLHDGSSRRDVAASLSASLAALDNRLAHDSGVPHEDLALSRKKLVAHRRQMHQPRAPHGMSFFILQAILGTPDAEATGLRLSEEALQKWTEEGRATVRARLAEWRGLAERLDEDPTGMWSSATLRSAEEAERATAEVADLLSTHIPAVEEAHRALLIELESNAEAGISVTGLAEFVATVNELSDRYEAAFMENAASFASALAPCERSPLGRFLAQAFNGAYREARRDIAEFGIVEPLTALQDARRAVAVQQAWTDWYPNREMPRRAESGAALVSALDEYTIALDRLIAAVPALGRVEGLGEQVTVIGAMNVHRHLAGARAQLAIAAEEIGEFGLGPLLRMSSPGDRRRIDLGGLAMRVFAASAIDAITWLEPELGMFDGVRHQKSAERFVELDGRHLAATAQRVMREVAARGAAAMEEHSREAALMRHESGLKSLQMPVRQLIARAPHVVKALRPCWAMSPLLVSQMLPATRHLFDVVVFDEASELLAVDAIPAIARGTQLLVAGDPYQLPPSRFSAAETSDDEEEPPGGVVEFESILDVMRNLLVEQRLLWHYRSEDERLINFSNTHTYGRSLISFPGTNRGTGVRHVLVDGLPETSEGTTSNPAVVSRVVELILEHAATNPGESLGVIATGNRNAEAITEALRLARIAGGDEYDGFFDEKGAEPFFIKTIDRAQGDERDHIIFSMGYGRNPAGEMVYRWGLVGRAGGERRLNVAVTRAKRRMTVVSSVASHEIDPTRTRSRGAALLAQYLEYAERGGELSPGRDIRSPLTAFETSVRDRLQAAGIPVQPHYGVGQLRLGFAGFADFGMSRPVLAIETDGVAYNSSVTARDRDRLRPEALQKRGWRFHRIWSIDWYRDPDGETAKVLSSWERAVREARDLEPFDSPSTETRPVVAGRGRSPITVRRSGILDYSRAELVQLVRWIESDNLTRTDDELLNAAIEVLGFPDASGRVGRALRAAIEEAHPS
jgi:hypothetical protein